MYKTSIALAGTLFGAALIAGHSSPTLAQSIKAETAGPGCPHTVMILSAKYASRAGVNIQVNEGKTLTKSAMLVAQKKIDIASFVPAPYVFMKKGVAMYKKLGKKRSSAMAANLRGMYGYECGFYHPIVWDKSPIKKWSDLKGKKVFTGPPSGAAAVMSESFIRAMTGFEPNKEYTAVRLNWGSGQQAMRDGQLDAYVRPMTVPSAMMEELVGIRPVRLLEVTKADTAKSGFKKMVGVPGRGVGKLPANTYKGIVNNRTDQILPSFGLTQIAGAHVPDDVIYKITKGYFDNIAEIHKANPWLANMSRKNPFSVLNVPLHPGAYKYFKEIGVKVPKRLMPPA
ncbi:MAG: TAXI family TRAP transporter solute-binding subunit [Rhodospirillaceae bacterium]|nr:TAXI family TRAP transporter solute-binding subunit [Rhodospirillaceae bacterium]MBT4673304.1 TAXI family TRAP transporter solute-binding subunit [Rhodospirillaceae bacterium]MBT7572230.1 TAXI family TRAP transporter solute-binding subunit [Rhodospirillaceae bacterium]